MTEFTPVTSLAGGLMIGLAVALLWLFNGKIGGISGICASAVLAPSERLWKGIFLIGLVLGGALFYYLSGNPFVPLTDQNEWRIITAGLLVGIGTQLGSGCTSGHGVCGMSRLSPRSIVATITFMLTAGVTVYLWRVLS
ncbi:MAG: hypothetical protein CMF25_06865 [Kangiellaceae bacterium]|mgnify:CR=1 FL=1|jgi:uncharacterized membrane protein YedE/YeeE|nr:hypothetical protein [Kangiellaceae bacterium]|tara:strand:- start:4163 stop:4579 length:417 start_codon:yes stop_codon:yes gene_type:complete